MSDDNIAQFKSKADKKAETTGWIEGPCKCVGCGHRWHGCAPAGTRVVDCPACSGNKGIFNCAVDASGPRWVCNCQNDVFMVTPTGFVCVNCGVRTGYDKL